MVLLTVRPSRGPITQRFGENSTLDPAFQASDAFRIYGNYQPAGHLALDFGGPHGEPILAAHSGVLRFSGDATTMPDTVADLFMHARGAAGWPSGNCAMLDAGDGTGTTYSHLLGVAPIWDGSFVNAGQVLGWLGSTGRSTGDHLHFEYLRLPAPNDGWLYGREDPLLHFPAGGLFPTAPGSTGAPAQPAEALLIADIRDLRK